MQEWQPISANQATLTFQNIPAFGGQHAPEYLAEAQTQLLSHHYNVNEVAQTLGYNDATNFISAFKKYSGYTPGKISKMK